MNKVYAISFRELGDKKRKTVIFMSTEKSYSENLNRLINEYDMDKRTLKFVGPTIPTILDKNGDSILFTTNLEDLC